MNLKKNLKRPSLISGQAIVEYIIMFTLIALGIVVICGGFNLGDTTGKGSNLNIRTVFNDALNRAITEIQN